VVTLLILIKDDEGVGYLIIFLIFFAKILIESAVLAYLLSFVYQKVTITLTSKKSSNRVNVIIAVILAVFIGGKYSYETASHTLLSDELRKKGKLLNKISESYGVDWTSDLNTQKAIQIGIFDSIYSVTNNTISHGYGGSIEILTDTRGVSVIYHDIPSKEIAFQFYYTLMSGLTDTYVDEKSTKTITHSKEIEKRKRELCYTGKKSVTVRYTTAFGNLKK